MPDPGQVLSHSRIRTLVVDDSPAAWQTIGNVLDTDPRIEIVGHAGNGQEAIRLADEQKPDLVLMDFRMPGMNGMEATKELLERHPKSRVIVVTDYATPEVREACVAGGAQGFVAKDRLHQDLISEIRRVFGFSPDAPHET